VDYLDLAGATGTIPAGQRRTQLMVQILPDTALEPNETFTISLVNVAGATVLDGEATVTILNDEGPTLSVSDVAVAEGQSGTQVATVGIALSEPSDAPVTFDATAVGVTAAAGRLLVKQYQPAIARETLLVLDLNAAAYDPRSRIDATELAIIVAASLAHHISVRQRLPVGLTTEALDGIEGERREEYEEDRDGFYRTERTYGSFCRVIPLPDGAITDSAKANFNNGVLEIVLEAPSQEARRGRRIDISGHDELKK